MEYGVLLLILAAVACGVTSAVITTWSLRSRVYSLEDRVAIIEGTVTREVKIRAATDRWVKPNRTEEAITAALAIPVAPPAHKNWWMNPNLKKGAHAD